MKLIKSNNINLIHLKGTQEEMAAQHGHLLKNEIKQSALFKLSTKNQFMITQGGGLLKFKIIQNLIVYFYNNILINIMALSLPNTEKRKLKALSKSANISYQTVLRAFFQADALMILAKLTIMKHSFINFPLMNLPGCSSTVVSSKNTKSKSLLVMRNQDYPIVGPWEKNTTIALCEPSEAGHHKHMFVTSAGLHTGGLTAMNEKGITVAVHAHFGENLKLDGVPIFTIAEKVIRKSSSIECAKRIIEKERTYANWAIVVSSANEDKAVSFEITPQKFAQREMTDGIINHTNYFQTRDLNKTEALINGARHEDDMARNKMMNLFCRERAGQIQVKDLIELCGTHSDPHSKTDKIFGNTLSVITTVKSVVMDPKNFTLYASTKNTSPVGVGDFAKIDVDSFNGSDLKIIPNQSRYKSDFLDQLSKYRLSYIHAQMNGDFLSAYKELKEISGENQIDPHINLQCAYIALKLDKYSEAGFYLNCVNEKNITHHLKNCLYFFKSIVLKKQNKNEEHKNCLKKVKSPICEKLSQAIKKSIKKNYSSRDIMLDMQFPEPIEY